MYTLPSLPYSYSSLEPYVDEETMKVHHDKHHKAYMDKLNTALEKYPELQEKESEELLKDLEAIPEDIRTSVINNGGGYYHHNLFWEMISKEGGGEPKENLAKAIDEAFGSFEKFEEQFTQKASAHFASGWVWLVKDKEEMLSVIATPNQDSPISKGLKPLIGIDVWEHAYYLKYQNRRPEFIEAWWNIVNWDYAEKRFMDEV